MNWQPRGVYDAFSWRWSATAHGGPKSRQRQLRVSAPRDRVTNHLGAAGVQKCSKVGDAILQLDIGEVCHPDHVQRIRDDVEIEVGEYAAIFFARLGLERELALGDGIQRPLPHDSGRPVVIDVSAPSGKLSSDTAASIAGKLVLDGIDHFGKLVIAGFDMPGS